MTLRKNDTCFIVVDWTVGVTMSVSVCMRHVGIYTYVMDCHDPIIFIYVFCSVICALTW